MKSKKNSNEVTEFDMAGMDFGRTPPNAMEFEKKILGGIMIDNEVLLEVMTLITDKHFYSNANAIIFKAIISLYEKQTPADTLLIAEELRKTDELEKIGGVDYILELTESVVSSANMEYYCRILIEKWIGRNIIHTSSEMISKSLDHTSNIFEVLNDAERQILDISESMSKKKVINVKDELSNLLEDIKSPTEQGLKTGYYLLDDKTGGLQKAELIIIAGRPSHGKTAFSCNIAQNIAAQGKNIAFFSIEMATRELMIRLISAEARVNGQKLKNGKSSLEDWNRINSVKDNLLNDFYIDDSAEITALEIRAKCRKLHNSIPGGLDAVFVDYLQLVKGPADAERRDLEVAYVSRNLKALAKELNIPVVAAAQLNRNIENRGKEKRPQLSDLRESGSIEQDADVVIFVHRPIMGTKYNAEDPEIVALKRKAEIIIGKQRNGPVGDLELVYLNEYTKFENQSIEPKYIDNNYSRVSDPISDNNEEVDIEEPF